MDSLTVATVEAEDKDVADEVIIFNVIAYQNYS